MIIKINGKEANISGEKTLSDIIDKRGLAPEKIVVEHNGNIIPKEQLAGIDINENDRIEIISFVGGG